MLSSLIQGCRRSIQYKLFLSLAAIISLSFAAILASQVYLIQDYFINQAEANLRSSNYLLSRALADPLFSRDLVLLQKRLHEVQTRLPLCNFQIKDKYGRVFYKVGNVKTRSDTVFNPYSSDGCFNTLVPVIHKNHELGMIRIGVRIDEIAHARTKLIKESAFYALFWFVILMLPLFIQIRRIVRPLSGLSEAAQQISNGNLDCATPKVVNGEDEISQLTINFQGMAQTLVRNRDEQLANLGELRNEKSTLNTLLATMPIGVIFSDHHNIVFYNDAFRKMCLFDQDDELVGMKNDAMLLRLGQLAADAEAYLKMTGEILKTHELIEPKYVELRDGRTLKIISNIVVGPESGNNIGRFWIFEDATEEKNKLNLAEARSEKDALTSLYNRLRFDQDLSRLLSQAERDGTRLALLIFDLDNFKPVNDKHGHNSGDVVLKKIADTLTEKLRRNEVVYRIGGDEFALLLVNESDKKLATLANRIVTIIQALDFEFDGTDAKVGCSLGIARYPRDADTLQMLVQNADQAMYAAKKQGKNKWVMFSDIK